MWDKSQRNGYRTISRVETSRFSNDLCPMGTDGKSMHRDDKTVALKATIFGSFPSVRFLALVSFILRVFFLFLSFFFHIFILDTFSFVVDETSPTNISKIHVTTTESKIHRSAKAFGHLSRMILTMNVWQSCKYRYTVHTQYIFVQFVRKIHTNCIRNSSKLHWHCNEIIWD